MSAPSIIMCVGREYYSLKDVIDEYSQLGTSKRISMTSIPQGLVRGESKVFIAHPDAIIKVTAKGRTIADLVYEMYAEGATWEHSIFLEIIDGLLDKPYWTGEELQPGDFVPDDMLWISIMLSAMDPVIYTYLVKTYELEFCMGIIGFSPFSEIQLVLPDDVEDLPDNLRDLEPYINSGVIQPVHVSYTEDSN